MRKLTPLCDNAQLHHGLAAIAITEGGVSKKKVNAEGYRRTVRVDSDNRIIGEGEYWLQLEEDDNRVLVKTFANECVARWKFTYPAWKLEAYSLRDCSCSAPHDL